MEENNGVFIDKEDIYDKKINIVSPKTKESEVNISNNIYDNIIALGTASQFDLSSINSLTQQANTRNEMYNRYDTMCEDGRISSVIQTYGEDATERNDAGDIVWATSDDPKISYLVNYYLDSLNVNKNIYKWAFSLCKYGDLYVRLYRESEYEDALFAPLKKKSLNEDLKIKAFKENDKYAHYIEMVTNPAEMFELTKFGKTVGYIQSPVDGVIVRSQQNLDFMSYAYKFKKQDITLYPPTEFVHAAIEDNIGRFDETVNIFLNTEDYDSNTNANSYSVKRGQSLLASAYKIWRELQLLEASVLLNRVTKSSIVRLINVEVGDMPKENVSKTLMGIKQMIEQKAAINTGLGMTEYTNPGPIENNVYVPTHDRVGTISSTQIGGDVDVKSLADLDWYLNKLYGTLKVPKQYFSQVDDAAGFSGGQSLTIISSRYAKTVKHIQTTLCQMITDLINLILLDKKLDSYINKFEIHMQPPVTQEDIDRRESQSTKVQLASDIMDMLSDIEEPISRLRILKNLLVNIVNDNDIIEEIQSQINTLEEENSEEITDTTDVMTKENELVTDENNVDNQEESPIYFDTDDADEPSKDEVVLPSAEELGINLADDEK